MRKLNKREKLLSAIIGILAGILILYFLAYVPLIKRLTNLNEKIQEKEIALRRGLGLALVKDRLIAEYRNIQGFLVAKGTEEKLVADFLKEIGVKAREVSVSLIDLKPQAKAIRISDYKKYLIDLSIEGTMEQVVSFIYGLETCEYALKVEKCALSLKAEDSQILKADISVSGIIIPENDLMKARF